ncbi:MAG: hypothetical protein IPN47_23395 [Gemmatimonadetes bacterium]|nr:hypothetical protein [Gemmatimonadota bacterium]
MISASDGWADGQWNDPHRAIAVGDIDPWTFTASQGDAIALSIGKVACGPGSGWYRRAG